MSNVGIIGTQATKHNFGTIVSKKRATKLCRKQLFSLRTEERIEPNYKFVKIFICLALRRLVLSPNQIT
jgi:hypothetical protein